MVKKCVLKILVGALESLSCCCMQHFKSVWKAEAGMKAHALFETSKFCRDLKH